MPTHSRFLAWKIPLDRGAWWALVSELTKCQTQLGTAHILFQILFQFRLSQNFEQRSLCLTAGPCWLPVFKQQCVRVHPKLPVCLSPSSPPTSNHKFLLCQSVSVKSCRLKKERKHYMSWELSFICDKMMTEVQRQPQIALRNGSREARGRSVCM